MKKLRSILIAVVAVLAIIFYLFPEMLPGDVGTTEPPGVTEPVGPTEDPVMTEDPGPTEDPEAPEDPGPTEDHGPTENVGQLTVHYIDVGQADSILLECQGQTMLIDGGNVGDSSLVVSYLDSQGISYLDYVICTHAHEDHVGGLSGPLSTGTAGAVYAPVTKYDSDAFRNFLKYTHQQGLEVTLPQTDDSFLLGEALVTVLGPRRNYTDTNDTSIVLRVDHGENSFLFTGDMEIAAEADLLSDGCDLDVDVLKVGHHGSYTSTGYVFLREVMPEYAVISCGTGNSYGHPHEEVTSRLYDAGVTVYRTDQQGTVVVTSDGTELYFTTEKNVPPTEGRE